MIYPFKITWKGFGIVVAMLLDRRQTNLKWEIVLIGGKEIPILYKVVGFQILCNAIPGLPKR